MEGTVAGLALLTAALAAVGWGLYRLMKAAVKDGVREALREIEAERAASSRSENTQSGMEEEQR